MKNLATLSVFAVLATFLFAGCKANNNTVTTNSPETTAQAVQVQQVTEEALPEPLQTVNREPETVAPNKPEVPVENKQAVDVKPTESAVKPNNPPATQEVKVNKDDVKKTVLNHAGLNENEVSRYKAELDKERVGLVYEVEFDSGKYEYDYKVDAETGKVLKAEKEFRD